MQDLRRTLAQCQFFFPAHIAAVANDIDTACIDVSIKSQVDNPSDETLRAAHNAEVKVGHLISQWPAPFSEVMTFRDVE